MKKYFLFIFSVLALKAMTQTRNSDRSYFELRMYEFHDDRQLAVIDEYLSKAFIPFLHERGIGKVGAFTWMGNDTAKTKRLYVLIPARTMATIANYNKAAISDPKVMSRADAYINATSEAPAYQRIVTYFIEGFRLAPNLMIPNLKSSWEDRVYELRSYEGASEKKYLKKVEMFNEGGEIDIFKRLNFNAVFYGEVLSGPTMPNLMYMTSFENMKDRDAHWQSFRDDAAWKELSAKKEYEKTVSKNVTLFLKARPFSEY